MYPHYPYFTWLPQLFPHYQYSAWLPALYQHYPYSPSCLQCASITHIPHGCPHCTSITHILSGCPHCTSITHIYQAARIVPALPISPLPVQIDTRCLVALLACQYIVQLDRGSVTEVPGLTMSTCDAQSKWRKRFVIHGAQRTYFATTAAWCMKCALRYAEKQT
jgi:hypothetical protein